MVYYNVDSNQAILNKIKEIVRQKHNKMQAKLLSEFVDYYYAGLAQDDLCERDVLDLYGAALSHWNFLSEYQGNKEAINVYNPDFEKHGWSSKHTVIEIAAQTTSFLVESLRMLLNRLNLTIHLIVHPGSIALKRNKNGDITDIETIPEDEDPHALGSYQEPIYIEVDRQTDEAFLKSLKKNMHDVFDDIKYVVRDWPKMKASAVTLADELENLSVSSSSADVHETLAFLRWIANDHFTFLGTCDFDIDPKAKGNKLLCVDKSQYGLYRKGKFISAHLPKSSTPEGRDKIASDEKQLIIQVYSEPSTVHRPSVPYCIIIKRYSEHGKLIGERRFIGHFTSVAYHGNPRAIPFLRKKVERIIELSGFAMKSHAGREMLNILESYPRDDLMLTDENVLLDIAMGIMHLQERQRVRFFMSKDPYSRYFSCLVYVPRERYTSQLRERISQILMRAFNGTRVTFSPRFSESVLARLHMTVYLDIGTVAPKFDVREIEDMLIETGRTWQDDLSEALLEHFGEEVGAKLNQKYCHAFPAGYCEHYAARTAVYDIEHMEQLHDETELGMSFYRPLEQYHNRLRFKLFGMNHPIPLSDVLPILENLGFRVIAEHSHEILISEAVRIWINEFDLFLSNSSELDVDSVRDNFQDTFAKVWAHEAENDGFNRVVLLAGLDWRETTLLRAYAKYFKQIGFTFSQAYIEETVAAYPGIVKLLIELFHSKFNPHLQNKTTQGELIIEQIQKSLDAVDNLDQDRILRQFLDAIKATLRTNYYQLDSDTNTEKSYISFKLNPAAIPDVPLPHPHYEIFVYSPRVEGVHLRAGKVARGGLRWSDRREDFRTEILGLMKAQQVKNAVIVPTGAKGGFVPKMLPAQGERDVVMQEVVACYTTFIKGLLDITDNRKDDKIIIPPEVVRFDKDDPYLVVAADKGTATFSDTANAIAQSYDFWLDDAFASGGSVGYDHKKMGITARGGWESVKRHFRELNINVQEDEFTVIGVGDMSGDVFGNGMLLSEKIKLVAAFNHQHIFIDPNPDCKKSFAERKRLFALPRSTWEDYDAKALSKGGAIYSRTSKSIKISPEAKIALDVKKSTFTPTELIKAILKAPVDLFWNGGIGTYVKASHERHGDVGDRANDILRINGKELRCRVVGEGGNLGLTQLGRIEYNLAGGISFTDFIDNAGGVDCSDKEVNLKILLNDVVTNGEMTGKQRNKVLLELTDEIGLRVLDDNYRQTQSISFAAHRARVTLEEYVRFLEDLERLNKINRELEFLPDEDEIANRKAAGLGLTRPEISVLMSYSKILLKEAILACDIPEEDYLKQELRASLPAQLVKKYGSYLDEHRLRREIIANQVANAICNRMGATFIKRLYDETGASTPDIVKAFVAAHDMFEMSTFWHYIQKLDYVTPTDVQYNMMTDVVRLVRRATRWILRNRREGIDIEKTVGHFKAKIDELYVLLPDLLMGIEGDRFAKVTDELKTQHVNDKLALRVAGAGPMISALDIIEASNNCKFTVKTVAKMYFALGERLNLDWFRYELGIHPVGTSWDALARAACRDDLDRQQRSITESILTLYTDHGDVEHILDIWQSEQHLLIERWKLMIADLKAAKKRDYNMFTVALRELLDIVQASNSLSVSKRSKKTKSEA